MAIYYVREIPMIGSNLFDTTVKAAMIHESKTAAKYWKPVFITLIDSSNQL